MRITADYPHQAIWVLLTVLGALASPSSKSFSRFQPEGPEPRPQGLHPCSLWGRAQMPSQGPQWDGCQRHSSRLRGPEWASHPWGGGSRAMRGPVRKPRQSTGAAGPRRGAGRVPAQPLVGQVVPAMARFKRLSPLPETRGPGPRPRRTAHGGRGHETHKRHLLPPPRLPCLPSERQDSWHVDTVPSSVPHMTK